MKKLYVVSSTEFDNLDEAECQLQSWFEDGELDQCAMVYEVSKKFKPVIGLEVTK